MEPGQRARAHVPHPLRPYAPLIVNAALAGMVPTRSQVAHVPVTPEQIVGDAVACVDAGATILHLHARRADESPAWERAAYEAIIPGMAYLAAELLDRGTLTRPLYANLILGSVDTAPATARSLAHLVDALPPDTTWATEVRERLGLPS
jgi:uncharacterized protein (DUF849 family)